MKTAAETLDYILNRIQLIDEGIAKYGEETTSDRITRHALADLAEYMTGDRP